MLFTRSFVLLAALLLMGSSDGSSAAQPSHELVTNAEKSLRGTWYSSEGTITFKNNGTINYKGKRYYYAVTNGGLIQLSGKHSTNAISYQLSGGQLTLTDDGKSTVYLRHRRARN